MSARSQPRGPRSPPASQPRSTPASQPGSTPASQPRSPPASQPAAQPGSTPAAQPAAQPGSTPAAQPASQPEPVPMEIAAPSNISEVDLRVGSNNFLHNTNEFTLVQLIVRRGHKFSIKLKFKVPFNPAVHNLVFTASTGEFGDEDQGTKSVFGLPDKVKRSPLAKAVWKAEYGRNEEPGYEFFDITPPADAPVGIYFLSLNFLGEDKKLGMLAVLFNPFCPEDTVYMADDQARKEYVMNENGVIFVGSGQSPHPLDWSYSQFEDDMVEIIFHLLHMNSNHLENPVKDQGAWADPVYVGRVISSMINSNDDDGVLLGKWGGGYFGGRAPTHWSDSHSILSLWKNSNYRQVKYGQCWVFAAVMCSVMRALGIPCRVITNFQSAHDTDANLKITEYRLEPGAPPHDHPDSVWNFHVWVEGWMTRPDLPKIDGIAVFDGWQVLDPTPQELSGGKFQCGPAPVKAILQGNTNMQYDVPFVFAEVNADRVTWVVKADGSKVYSHTDTDNVGFKTSTKAIGSKAREIVVKKYKPKEGTKAERKVFAFACEALDFEDNVVEIDGDESEEEEEPDKPEPPLPELLMKFVDVSKMVNGQDVKLNLVLHSEAAVPRSLSIAITVKAKNYTGTEYEDIQDQVITDTLLPGKDLVCPVVVPFSKYWKPMLDRDVMRISAIVCDTNNEAEVFTGDRDVVLAPPPINVKLLSEARVNRPTYLEIAFRNPVYETLEDCTLCLSGSGLWRYEQEFGLPILLGKRRVRVKCYFFPYKKGKKTLVVDFNCSVFRDIKKSIEVEVE